MIGCVHWQHVDSGVRVLIAFVVYLTVEVCFVGKVRQGMNEDDPVVIGEYSLTNHYNIASKGEFSIIDQLDVADT